MGGRREYRGYMVCLKAGRLMGGKDGEGREGMKVVDGRKGGGWKVSVR